MVKATMMMGCLRRARIWHSLLPKGVQGTGPGLHLLGRGHAEAGGSAMWLKVCGKCRPVSGAPVCQACGRTSAAGLSGNQSVAQVKGEGEAQAAGRMHPTSLAPGVHLSIRLLTDSECG